MLVNMKEILNKAKIGKYAVPHLNINNLEWAKYMLEACEEMKSPVIIGVSEGASKYMGGFKVASNIVANLVESLKITIPVAIHLDHGTSYEVCKEALDAGFTSVMIDASKQPLDENISITKNVVNLAIEYNASVEAEIGHIGGIEDGIIGGVLHADVNECVRLVKESGIDALAPALGSAHGVYKGEPKLDFERMQEIATKTNIPLVLHGASGIPNNQIIEAIECGTCKINLNTEFQVEWYQAVKKFIAENPNTYDPRKVISAGEKAIKDIVKEKVSLFRANNKA